MGLHSAQAVELIQETLLNGLAVGVIPVGTLVCGIIQLEVCHGEVQEIFLHIEAGVFGVEKAHEHQTKGKGAEDKKGPFFVTPQIGPGHGGQGGAPPPFFLLLLEPGAASVYRSASTGETFPASRAGRRHEMITVK